MPVRARDATLTAAHAVAVAVVVAGVAAQVVRPLAPPLPSIAEPTVFFEPAYVARAVAYRQPLYAAGLVALAVRVAVPLLAAWTAAGRRLTGRVVERVGEQRPVRAAAAVVVLLVVATDLLLLPLTFWAGFVHEGTFGLRTQGVVGWAYDWLVAHVPPWIGVTVLALGGFALARRLPRAWPAAAGLIAAALGAVVAFAAPLVLEPLEFDLTPLPQGPVRREVEEVLARAGEDVTQILMADASRRTRRENAYVSGLGASGRVVLYDNLVRNQPPDQVAVVLAHELGHERHRDVARGAAFAAAGAITAAYIVAAIAGSRTRRGQQAAPTDPRAAAVLLAAVVALTVVSTPLQSLVSRRAEAAADLASLDLSRSPETYERMQLALTRANLGEPAPPRWVYGLWGSHPPPVARLSMGRAWPNLDADREAAP